MTGTNPFSITGVNLLSFDIGRNQTQDQYNKNDHGDRKYFRGSCIYLEPFFHYINHPNAKHDGNNEGGSVRKKKSGYNERLLDDERCHDHEADDIEQSRSFAQRFSQNNREYLDKGFMRENAIPVSQVRARSRLLSYKPANGKPTVSACAYYSRFGQNDEYISNASGENKHQRLVAGYFLFIQKHEISPYMSYWINRQASGYYFNIGIYFHFDIGENFLPSFLNFFPLFGLFSVNFFAKTENIGL